MQSPASVISITGQRVNGGRLIFKKATLFKELTLQFRNLYRTNRSRNRKKPFLTIALLAFREVYWW